MEKSNEENLIQNKELETIYILIDFEELKKKLKKLLFKYYAFENILLNIINNNYNLYKERKDINDFNLLTSPQHIINILYYYNYEFSEQLEYIKNKYKDNQLWQELKETAKELNPHNLTYIIKRVKTAFNTYFTSLELYKQNPSLFQGEPKPPITKNIHMSTNYSVELDKYCSLSFVRLEKENLVGINLSDHMIYISLDKTEKDKTKYETKNRQTKYAGIDIGERNLMAVFVDDETTKSLLIDGKPFKHYNETELLIEQFYKMANLVVEYLHLHGVTDLFISKNLAEDNPTQIPFIKLIEAIEHEAQSYGIKVHYVDESYTSQVSCISGDIKGIQENSDLIRICNIMGNFNPFRTFNGKRNGQSFHDTVIKESFNADLNAAVNHIKVGTGKSFEWLKDKLFKLKDPIKIKSEDKFRKLIDELKSSKEAKSNET
jgi:IS605 OrfB family transposase